MIIINNPNNPTGAVMPRAYLEKVAEFAKSRNIILFSDEVYHPLFHSLREDNEPPPAVTALGYDKTIVTGSMSKSFAMAGIRIGWIVSRDRSIIETLAAGRDYTTISVSQLDDQIASFALSPAVRPHLLYRNNSLAAKNLALLKTFVDGHSQICRWREPTSGTTALVQFYAKGKPVDDVSFCKDLLNSTKILFVPGSHCFGDDKDFTGYVRIGYACKTSTLVEALGKLHDYAENHLASSGLQ